MELHSNLIRALTHEYEVNNNVIHKHLLRVFVSYPEC